MRSIPILLINIFVVVIIGGLNILMRYLTQKQRKASKLAATKEPQDSVQVLNQEPEEYFRETVREKEPDTLFQKDDWFFEESERTIGVKRRRTKIGPKRLRQAIIMSEVIREPRAQRPWPMR